MRADGFLAEAISLHQQGKHAEAEASYRAVLRTHPGNFTALHHLGVLALGQNKLDEARDLITRALAIDGSSSEAHNNIGNVLRAQGNPEEAILAYNRATRINPSNAGALSNLAIALMDQNKYAEAITALEKAVELDPRFVEAHYNLGSAYGALQKPEKAVAEYRAAIRLAPSLFQPYVNLGSLLSELGHLTEAAEALEKATDLQPNPVAFNSLGTCYHRAGRIKEAEECFRKAAALQPDFVEALTNLGINVAHQGRRDEAIELFRAALRINPNFPNAVANLFFEQRHLCDWQDFEATLNKLRELVRAGARISPFSFLTANTPPDEQLLCARNWATLLPPRQIYAISPAARRPGRIRIGYLSSDFKEHATAFLIAEMLEHHDHQRFEIYAYSYGIDDGSEIRSRLVAAFDHFVEVRAMSHEAAIRRIRDDGIDILVDLKGYTQDARTEIMAGRPAPIQVAYLGYPGTMGADCIDYMIADHFVVPLNQRRHFSEKLVYLPHCYQPNDTKRAVSTLGLTRRQFGLPEDGFVFCSFNGNYKITPSFFDVWMRLLKDTPGSVLWLLETGTRVHLLRTAEARGVDPERIVFAQGLVHAQHLERMALADLFLDSLPVNAHTTASDAMWAGLPLLTCAGTAFVGRVAGSVLHTIGLPELVTASLDEYEAKALHLAQNPAELKALRERLSRNKLTSPLFDIASYTRDLETGYQIMFDRWLTGHSPDVISVQEEVPAQMAAQALPRAQAEAKHLKAMPTIAGEQALDGTASLPDHWKQVQLVVFAEDNNPHSAAVSELAEFFAEAFRALGAQAAVLINSYGLEGINLFFNSHRLSEDLGAALPGNGVIINLEQLRTILPSNPSYANLLKRFPVWDYSAKNIQAGQAMLGRDFTRVCLGFTPRMARIVSVEEPEIDVLFYGSLNARRQAVLEELRLAGLKVVHLFGVYGEERDAAIANAKVVLNLHYYEDSIHELVRTSYLLANKKAVVSEAGPGTEIEDGIREAMIAVPYEGLVEACISLVKDERRRRQLEKTAFEIFSRRDQARLLAEAAVRTSPALPAIINLGSGKSWSPDVLNIDIDPKWGPDLLGDISEPGWLGRYFTSDRFGLQRLSAERFDAIIARDVLEHVPALPQLMTTCLALLREGGRMVINVPYDLSFGAWQDPTHVRAFNERSWLYYTDWHWYLGWLEARFDVESLNMVLSPFGVELTKQLPPDEVYRRPRAVDSMDVVLIKRRLTDAEKTEAERFHLGAYRQKNLQ